MDAERTHEGVGRWGLGTGGRAGAGEAVPASPNPQSPPPSPHRERAAELLAAALDYAAAGMAVGPLWPLSVGGVCTCRRGEGCTSPGKHPWTTHGLHDFTTDPALIRRWWARRPFSGIGFATGTRSGRLVLDIDPRHGGHLALQELERRHGVLPHTPFVLTGGGGGHYHFVVGVGGRPPTPARCARG